MLIFVQILVATMAVSVFAMLFWVLYSKLLVPIRSTDEVQVQTTLTISGDASGLEAALDGFAWLRKNGVLTGQILLVDEGLSEEGQTLVELLIIRHSRLEIICAPKS